MSETTAAEAAVIKLSEYDFRILLDCSGSMEEPVSASDRRSRWQAMQEEVRSFIRDLAKIDSDGVDLIFFGARIEVEEKVNIDNLGQILARYSPRGGTPLGPALVKAFELAKQGTSANKKDMTIVFTDGEPESKEAVEKAIIAQANSQQADDEHTVLIRQIGDDAGTSAWLRKLDDNLKGAKFDIVDCKSYEEAMKFNSTAELCLAAIND